MQQRYRAGSLQPTDLVADLLQRCEDADPAIWISRVPDDDLLAAARALEDRDPSGLPLWGIPFAVKDNIDAAALPTTAGCPAYAYRPERDAFAVRRLLDAGALLIGKTNLDQFATGLVGTRTPYGIPANAIDRAYVPGGSSSGSAVAVAKGLVSFALGTDTAGSGRVPAAFNGLVGLKPSCGLVSTSGVVPACRSLDCVSIFASDTNDARSVLDVVAAYDPDDAYSRNMPLSPAGRASLQGRRFAVPGRSQLEFFGDVEAAELFDRLCGRLSDSGAELIVVDFAPFAEAAALLYQGPRLAERYLAVGEFIAGHDDAVHPVTREIIMAGKAQSAADAFSAFYRLAELRRKTASVWELAEALLTPTTGTMYRVDDELADPIRLNTNLGYYTNFVNLLDLAAVAVPVGSRPNGLPFGVTISAPAGSDLSLLALASAMRDGGARGAEQLDNGAQVDGAQATQPIAVCGAHMSGLPLNRELLALGATLRAPARTMPDYRLYALPNASPARPGLIRVGEGEGAAIELEVWDLPSTQIGPLLSRIASPLGLGSVRLADGSSVHGFLCEGCVAPQAEDITRYGGWRAYIAAERPGADTNANDPNNLERQQ